MLENNNTGQKEKNKVRRQEGREEVNKAGRTREGGRKGGKIKKGKEEQKDNLSMNQNNKNSQGQVIYACNPSYSERQRSGGSWFEGSLGKQFAKTPISEKNHHKKGLV
jgi:hypothetical protein